MWSWRHPRKALRAALVGVRSTNKAPRDDGIFMWSWRHPRKALRAASAWLRSVPDSLATNSHAATARAGNSLADADAVSLREDAAAAAAGPAAAQSLAAADNWIRNSPVRMIEHDCGGYDIVEFEYKYFAVPAALGQFDYAAFKADGRLSRCLIGHSWDEARQMIKVELAKGLDFPRSYFVLGDSTVPVERLIALSDLPAGSIVFATTAGHAGGVPAASRIEFPVASDADVGRYLLSPAGAKQLDDIERQGFSDVVIPWTNRQVWHDNSMEIAASRIASIVDVIMPQGAISRFIGERVHRLIYNKAYLASLFSKLPFPEGLRVLEIGCSDGMVCSILKSLGAREVIGIDIMETAGCAFPRPGIFYRAANAHALPFDNGEFDLVVSIATFEHLIDPRRAFAEIARVLRPSGHAYVQAGPLYHSPFGHHMFGYFDEFPWIHLRKTPEEIAAYADTTGVTPRIQHDHGRSVAQYVVDMLNQVHVNGLRLSAYGLDELKARPDLTVMMTNISREGEDLLTSRIRSELARFKPNILTEHGFEVLFAKAAR
jgi:SAM-dependent methyltransferase